MVLENRHVQFPDEVGPIVELRLGLEPVPLPAEVHAELMGNGGGSLAEAGRKDELLPNLFHEALHAQPPQVLHGPVVIQDLQLLVGEEGRDEKVVFLPAGMRRIPIPPQPGDRGGRRRPVMPVGDVQALHLRKFPLQRPEGLPVADDPRRVGHAVGCREIVFGGGLHDPGDDAVDLLPGSIEQKDEPCLGARRVDVAHPLVFLVHPRQLVFLDPPRFVLGHADAAHDPDLLPRGVLLPVDVETGAVLLVQNALPHETPQVLTGPLEDPGVVIRDLFRDIDLGFFHAQEIQRVVPDDGPPLLPVEDVVGKRGHVTGESLLRPHGPERDHQRHKHLRKAIV